MGFDIYGVAPKGEQVKVPEQENKQKQHLEQLFSDMAAGIYFRLNIWGYRPVFALMYDLNIEHELGIDMNGWDYNDNVIYDDTERLDKLADLMDAEAAKWEAALIADGLPLDSDIYWQSGTWIIDRPQNTPLRVEEEWLIDELNELRNPNSYFAIAPKIDGVEYTTDYTTHIDTIRKYAQFLRMSGGIQIC